VAVLIFTSVSSFGGDRFQESAEQLVAEKLIYDKAKLLTDKECSSITALLSKHNKNGPGTISVLTITELPGEITIERYANELIRGFSIAGIGRGDNVLLLIAVKNRKLRIETSKGVSDLLADDYCHKIIEEFIAPRFKQKQYYHGIKAGVLAMIDKLRAH
jgi:uncharacterized protein